MLARNASILRVGLILRFGVIFASNHVSCQDCFRQRMSAASVRASVPVSVSLRILRSLRDRQGRGERGNDRFCLYGIFWSHRVRVAGVNPSRDTVRMRDLDGTRNRPIWPGGSVNPIRVPWRARIARDGYLRARNSLTPPGSFDSLPHDIRESARAERVTQGGVLCRSSIG